MSASALRALELMDEVRHAPLTVSELARRTGQDKASVSRTVSSLHAQGWLIKADGKVGLGTRAILLGSGPSHRQALDRTRELVHTVSGLTGLTTVATALCAARPVLLAQSSGPDGLPGFYADGFASPLWATAAGIVLLAQLADDAAAAIVDARPVTPLASRTPDRDGVLAEVALARRRGVAIDRGWSHDGARCVAVVYPWLDGTPAQMCVLGYEGMHEDRLAFTEAQLRLAGEPGATRTTLVEAAGRPGDSTGVSTSLVDVVQAAFRNFHKPHELARSPLAPIDGTVLARSTAVQRRLRDAMERTFHDTPADDELRGALTAGYLTADATHVSAIRKLHLGRTTYYRRLAEAITRVADTFTDA